MLLAREPVRHRALSRPGSRGRQRPEALERKGPIPGHETILYLQRQAGNDAVTGLLTGGMSALGSLAALAAELLWKSVATGETMSENQLTNELFWIEQPSLRGEKLEAGSPGAVRWLRIRDAIVRPLLHSDLKTEAPQASGATQGPTAGPPGMVPVDQIAASSAAADSSGAKGASTSDKYFVQDIGRYQDVNEKDQPRLWKYGSSGMNICNMTSLTMGLVSMAGEAEVRTKIIGLLRLKGMHKGAAVQIGGKWVPLAEALDDPKIADRIALIDLVTAAAIGEEGEQKTVTVPATLARVARESGLAAKAETVRGQPQLATKTGRTLAREMLASGKRVIAGTINHYVYLIEVRDDGVIVHDPAGARVEPTLTGPIFLHGGTVNGIASEWSRLDAVRRERAVRRVSTNPVVAAIVNRLVEIWAMDETERKPSLAALAKEHVGHIATGSTNFYATSEFAENQMTLKVSLA